MVAHSSSHGARPNLLVTLATYNEIDNLPDLIDRIERLLPEADILIVDDNSPDGTGRWCNERAATDARVHCIHRSGKLGLGSATLVAIHHALAESYQLLITLDADWSHDPVYLPALIEAAETADVAVGSRYCPGGGIEGWPLTRRVVSRLLNAVSRSLLRLPVCDASGAFRAYRLDKLREVDLDRVRATGYAYLEELLWHLRRAGATFVEVPIVFRERRHGRSKVTWHEAIGKIVTIARLVFRR